MLNEKDFNEVYETILTWHGKMEIDFSAERIRFTLPEAAIFWCTGTNSLIVDHPHWEGGNLREVVSLLRMGITRKDAKRD
jgi:hypothetical protein